MCYWAYVHMGNRVILEVCVDSIESAIAVDSGGADRIELCSSLLEGGLTPSPGVISTVLSKVSLGVFVMIRPRGGDFCYSADEFKAMEQDVRAAKQLGADGVVFGILTEDGRVDAARTHRLVEIARPLKVTFHRAFDMSRDLGESLEDLIRLGVDRVLTSGGEQNVELGQSRIANLQRRAKDRIILMAGAGITEDNVRQIISVTGVREIHASLRSSVPGPMRYRNEKVSMGALNGPEYERLVATEERVRSLLAVVSGEDLDVARSPL
jgi:copper homeostasis protein